MTEAQHKIYRIKLFADIIRYLEENGETTAHNMWVLEDAPGYNLTGREIRGILEMMCEKGIIKKREVDVGGHTMVFYDLYDGEIPENGNIQSGSVPFEEEL
ncbi:MAG: hypothetical protein F4X82_01760 [Candidatus Spechtbacteria bacterium SB0662_bin_43]|uniref:Uncharacterized protein n=1 Tax=Candidatus Spechtbacteria bacterium SB0662_bin_43 TaxID=2604897 RepID=A0A845DB04_9BACT|nr:hypothetical protein [Candidatus Spechtbacteria bacterium SB0662_bin_43]